MKYFFALFVTVITCGALAAENSEAPDNLSDVQMGGPSSVPGQVKADSEQRPSSYIPDGIFRLDGYEAFKDKLKREHGLDFGMDYNVLYQSATPSEGESNAPGGVFRFYGTWKPSTIDQSQPGSLVYKIEHRHSLGNDIAPKQLGGEVGYAGLTAVTFSDAGYLLTNLYWTQNFNDNQFAYVIGQVDVTDYVDIYGLVNIWTEFNNLAFTTNPAIPAPNQGLGAAVRWTIDNNYYVLAGFADANGNPGKPLDGFDTFFKDREYFKHLEFGWAGSWENHFTDNIHLTLWQMDELEQADVPDGWGTAFSFSREFGHWLPFLRMGYGDGGGAILDRSISTGFGYSARGGSDRLSLGLNWGRPNADIYSEANESQYTIESYYRMQVAKHLQVTPDIQLLLNPALNPQEDLVWVLGLRARLAF